LKLGKTSWLILSAGILIIVFGSLGGAGFQQVNERNQLDEEFSMTELRLDKLQVKQPYFQEEQLKEQLNQIILQLEAARDALHPSIKSTEVIDSLFGIAKACGVKIIAINSSGLASEELEGITCAVIRLALVVEGNVSQLIDFITELNSDFTTGVVSSTNIAIPATTVEDRPSADIRLVIYSYKGS